ncbi:MAG TPA: hypothetical protein VFS20_14035 [Longimicrobium sp.]|nr:hypothetical protein [Longimicrobium sp.]
MNIPEVTVSPTAGPVSVRVVERRRLPGVVTVVWRFAGVAEREGIVGEISREITEVPLGAPSTVNGKGFLVDGFVVPLVDRPPAPYQVVVTVLQGGREVHQAVPPEHGSGTIGPEEIRFRYPFVVRVA